MNFDDQGNLFPYEIISTTPTQMAESLTDSAKRRELFNLFTAYSRDLQFVLNSPFDQLVGGSFVSRLPEPNDIDVANLIALPDPDDDLIEAIMPFLLIGGSMDTYQIDGHLIPVYAPDDERYANTIARIAYFRRWFGFDRHDFPRGILIIQRP